MYIPQTYAHPYERVDSDFWAREVRFQARIFFNE